MTETPAVSHRFWIGVLWAIAIYAGAAVIAFLWLMFDEQVLAYLG
jgi:hypothetical protein